MNVPNPGGNSFLQSTDGNGTDALWCNLNNKIPVESHESATRKTL